jgi:hypothetical protein
MWPKRTYGKPSTDPWDRRQLGSSVARMQPLKRRSLVDGQKDDPVAVCRAERPERGSPSPRHHLPRSCYSMESRHSRWSRRHLRQDEQIGIPC